MKSKKYVRKLSPLEETLDLACDTFKIVNSTIKTLTQKPHPLYEYETEKRKATILAYLGEDTEVLVIPDKIYEYPVESLENYSNNFLKNCPSLQDLTLPKNLKIIKGYCFDRASDLRYLRYHGDFLKGSIYSESCEIEKLCYLLESHTLYALLSKPQLIKTIHNALEESSDKLKLGDSPLAMLLKEEDMLNLFLEKGELAHYGWLLSDPNLISMYKLNKLLEKSISAQTVAITAMLLEYQENNFSHGDLERRELVSVGLELPTLEDLQTIWHCEETETGVEIYGFLEGDTEQLILDTLDNLVPISSLSNKNKYYSYLWGYDFEKNSITSPYQGLKILHLETTGSIAAHTFHGCTTLEEITLTKVTDLGKGAFLDCSSLKKVELSPELTILSAGTFVNCTALETIQLPDTVTEIQDSAFNGCTQLHSIILPKKLEILNEKVFHGCSSLKKIEIPSEVKQLTYDLFSGCSDLEEVILHDGLEKIGIGGFSYCKSLKEIQIPETVSSLGSFAFCHCNLLEKINLPKGITCLENSTFSHCSSLQELNLPSTVTEIKEKVFQKCSSLAKLSLFADVKKIDVTGFLGCDSLESITIFQRGKGGKREKSLAKKLQKILPRCSVDIMTVS